MSNFLKMSSLSNYKVNNYILNCDLVNKYGLKSVYQKPQLTKIILEFSSNSIFLFCENNSEWDLNLQVRFFLLLYILQSNYSFVNLNKFKITNEQNHYAVKIIISCQKRLQLFLITIFLHDTGFVLLKKLSVKYNKYVQRKKQFFLNTSMPVSHFSELSALLTNKTPTFDLKNLFIRVIFIFDNIKVEKKSYFLNLVKNLFLFWVENKKRF
jgi:hypothetical protein